ncbi:MAG: YciI-like protein [Chloroflexi bacterium]|nr:YciI-like protein [Chloroflexota bacterium]
MPATRFVLFYDYVENVVEKRAPFRADHLALAREYVDRGEIEMAGAFADPVDGAAFVFTVDDRSRVEAFVAADPYVANGLVPSWRIREWTVVIGGD